MRLLIVQIFFFYQQLLCSLKPLWESLPYTPEPLLTAVYVKYFESIRIDDVLTIIMINKNKLKHSCECFK